MKQHEGITFQEAIDAKIGFEYGNSIRCRDAEACTISLQRGLCAVADVGKSYDTFEDFFKSNHQPGDTIEENLEVNTTIFSATAWHSNMCWA